MFPLLHFTHCLGSLIPKIAKARGTGRKFLPSKHVMENSFIVISIFSVGKHIIRWFRESNSCYWDTVRTITTYIKVPSDCKYTLSFIARLYFWAGNSVTRTAKTRQSFFIYFSACRDFAAFILLTGFGLQRGEALLALADYQRLFNGRWHSSCRALWQFSFAALLLHTDAPREQRQQHATYVPLSSTYGRSC